MTRGGARAGAGRKGFSLSAVEQLMVGEHCEHLWRQAAEDQAMERHSNSTPVNQQIRDVQESAALVGRLARKYGMPEEITEDIDELTGGMRFVSIPLKRPYGMKGKILAAAIEWCRVEYGQIITTSKATECWKKYSSFQKWAKNKGSLNST